MASDVGVGAVVLLVAAFPLAAAAMFASGKTPIPWGSVLGAGCVLNQYTMILTGALLGATAFAREREEGVLPFLAQLPLTLQQQYRAKIFAAVLLWLILWAANCIILILTAPILGRPVGDLLPFLPRIAANAVLSFAALGYASAMGCRIRSVTGAAFAGLLLLMAIALARFMWTARQEALPFFTSPFMAAVAFSGMVGMAAAYDLYRKDMSKRQRSFDQNGYRTSLGKFEHPSIALVWKDIRMTQSALILGGAMLAIPILGGAVGAVAMESAAESFRMASILTSLLCWIVLPWWAANSLAAEWPERTQAFLAALPIGARQVVMTQLLVAVLPAFLACAVCSVTFVASTIAIENLQNALSNWDAFNQSGFLTGGVAYLCAAPVPFAVAWYCAARLRRKTLAIIIGILAGPVAMAMWAAASSLYAGLLPVQAIALHVFGITVVFAALVGSGTRLAIRHGLV